MPITELYIEGLRTIERVRLRLDGLTVLIGDNGSGKSSILEACEILRRVTSPSFLDEFHRIHGGLSALLRKGATRLVLGVTIHLGLTPSRLKALELTGFEALRYKIELTRDDEFATLRETISWKHRNGGTRGRSRKRDGDTDGFELAVEHEAGRIHDVRLGLFQKHPQSRSILSEYVEDVAAVGEAWWNAGLVVAEHLRRIQAHLPFEVIPAWAARALDRKSSLRSSSLLAPADQLDKLGTNLASAYHALKNGFGRAHWEKTLEYVQLGLGQHIEDVVTWADPGGGNVGLSLKLAGLDQPIPTAQISDGMLSYLAFVALFRLDRKPPSLLAFDEPDLHLHPHLLMRVLDLFETAAQDRPVLLATHSDRLLDGLRSPERSVVLCDLGPDGATRLLRPDADLLARWLERYRGLGDLRGAGHAASVLTKPEPS